MSRQDWSRLYRDWCVVGALGTAIAGFPTTPFGPLLLWAVILPAIASWLLRERRALPDIAGGSRQQRLRRLFALPSRQTAYHQVRQAAWKLPPPQR